MCPVGICLVSARFHFPRRDRMHVYEHEPVRRDERHASRVLFPCVCKSDRKKSAVLQSPILYPLI